MSSLPSSVAEVCGKDPTQVIDYLIAGSHRGLNSLIYSLRDDMTRHFPHLSPPVIEKVQLGRLLNAFGMRVRWSSRRGVSCLGRWWS